MKNVGKISRVCKVKLKLHKKLTMRGLYYRTLVSKIYSTKNKKGIKQNIGIEQEHNITENHLGEKGFLVDESC
ncbi:hypothetical protein [Clostridium thailandense]|uniref:hypothetical protein n=1 Tax=Clostridium thailandense TaxID=2794346 RepID=UPI00398940D3